MPAYNCSDVAWQSLGEDMDHKLWRVDALLLASAIMAVVIVGMGAYGQRYRHHPLTRLVFLGSTTLFLPIISSVIPISISSFDSIIIGDDGGLAVSAPRLIAVCNPDVHSVFVVTWAFLVQNIVVSTSLVVAIDIREGRSIGPPIELIAQGAWTLSLGINHIYMNDDGDNFNFMGAGGSFYFLELMPFLLTLAKLAFKCYAVRNAQRSFGFGRNPRLVFGYMMQQQQHPAHLLVMGEETRSVEKQPHGYAFKKDDDDSTTTTSGGLVTIDRAWQELDDSSMLGFPPPITTSTSPPPQSSRLKDLCLSFALFKLLRCRFARYKIPHSSSGSAAEILLLLDVDNATATAVPADAADRVFRVLEDELSFLHDYYYSPLPVAYSRFWLPVMGIFISLCSISYCIYLAAAVTLGDQTTRYGEGWWGRHQIECTIRCGEFVGHPRFGHLYFDLVPLFLLLVLLVAAEVRDLVFYTFSNWTKVSLTCRLLRLDSSGGSGGDDGRYCCSSVSLMMRKWYAYLVRRSTLCKIVMRHWDERMGQCSVLPPTNLCQLQIFVRRLLRLPDQNTELNAAMKAHILNALRIISRRNSNDGGRPISDGRSSLRRWGQQGETFVWACNSSSASAVILTWHIATSILEARYHHANDHRGVATRLSRYCAYLVALCPELLPDEYAWSKSLYKAVSNDARQALAASSSTPPGYQQLVLLLSANSKHEVLKNGVRLGQQLVDTIDGEQTAWNLLAGFWSEMILYVAPSDNLKGHKASIARGGELITLLWALLDHAGIVSRPAQDVACDRGCCC